MYCPMFIDDMRTDQVKAKETYTRRKLDLVDILENMRTGLSAWTTPYIGHCSRRRAHAIDNEAQWPTPPPVRVSTPTSPWTGTFIPPWWGPMGGAPLTRVNHW